MNDYPVYAMLREAALTWPNKPAVFDEHGMISFLQLFNETENLRERLTALNVGPGMGVGMMARNGRQFIMGLFAIVGCGATAMPMSHQLKPAEIEDMLKEAKLHAIIDDKSGVQPLPDMETEIVMHSGNFRFGLTGISSDKIFADHVHQPAFIRFTSGTTGKSKGVIISHQAVVERIEGANRGLELGPDDTVIWVLPMAYHFVVSVVLYVRFGTAIAIAKDFLAKNIIEITNQHHGTLLYASPVQIRLLAHDNDTELMPSLKKVISTSAGISLDVCQAFKKRFGINVSQAYGIIEIGLPMINLVKSAEHPDAVGYALPGYTIDILDEDHHPIPDGQTGYLGIKGPGMFDAYLLPKSLKEEVLQNGYFLTADYASKAADGLIKIEGRSKSVINITGIKIFPEEVEAVLETYPGIKQAKISSCPHALLGQIIEGEIILLEGHTVNTEEVIRYCKQRLSNFKAPQRLKIVESLPMTGSGKLQRH